MENKTIGILAGSFAAIAVILGALGAHALKAKLSPDQLMSFETGVKYQFYHALALLAVYIIQKQTQTNDFNLSAWFFLIGILLFSGSIYFLSTRSLFGMPDGLKFLGPVTPLGGVLMIAGWLIFVITLIKKG
jgi:uncharacterized membrane protein YgdD (TMEM256/DUF423 family)